MGGILPRLLVIPRKHVCKTLAKTIGTAQLALIQVNTYPIMKQNVKLIVFITVKTNIHHYSNFLAFILTFIVLLCNAMLVLQNVIGGLSALVILIEIYVRKGTHTNRNRHTYHRATPFDYS